MAKAYVIVTEEIHDSQGMAEYSKAAGPSLVEHAARVIAVEEHGEVLEGTWPGRTVIIEFDSVEHARAWYHSEGYHAAAKLRQAAATSNAVIVSLREPTVSGS
jgi:uncharacterized protein (DUF1330 family)